MKKSILYLLLAGIFACASLLHAGTKEELQRLQKDVGTLQDQIRIFEQTLNENNTALAGIKSLVEQLNDQVAKSSMLLDKVSVTIEQQATGNRSKEDEITQKIQSLSFQIDEMATSIAALARQVSDLKVQSRPVNPPVESELSVFNQAFYNLLDENYDLAIEGFNTYLTQFPSGEKATDALFNIGVAYYYMNQHQQAIKTFTQLIEENADSDKIANALYKRGEAHLGNQDSEKAAEDFKAVIARFPDSPEAASSKARLQDLGVAKER